MRKTQFAFSFILSAALLLGACAPASPTAETMMEKPTEVMMDKPTEVMMDKPTEVMMDKPTEVMMEKPTEVMMEKPTEVMMDKPTEDMKNDDMGMPESTPAAEMMAAPEWFGFSLTDVNTGETFTINDFKGKVVLVETMAVWCSNCLKQQKEIKVLHERVGMNEDFISIALDIDLNETADRLQAHASKNAFDWRYAVSSAELSRQIASLYGDQFLNPPSVPVLIVDRHGEVHVLPFGVKSADSLYEQVSQFLDGGM